MGTSLGACVFSIVTMYHKWDANPVTIIYGAELEPVSTVPFPAVTICPLIKSRIEVFNLTQAYETLSRNISLDEQSVRMLRALAHVCPFIKNWKEFKDSSKEDIVFDLRTMVHSLKSLMVLCWWRSSVVPCESIMMERLVDDGICYTFNSLALHEIYRVDQISPDFLNFSNIAPQSDWIRDYGYRPGAGLNAYPNLPLTNGLISGVIVVSLARQIDYEPLCTGTYTGFKLAVHTPDEVAWTDDRFYRLDKLTTLMLDLSPKVTRASKKLRNLSPFRRNCYFSDERSLRFFKLYNQINCVAECISNYTLTKCGCVKFSMPRATNTKVCDASKIDCYQNSFLALYEMMVRANLAGVKFHSCNCMPSCSSVDYGVAISHDVFNYHDFPVELDFATNGVDPSLVMVSFKDRNYASMLRREMLGINQAIAELGGLFTLLLGASMLSLAEIVYYCCIRWLRRERPKRIKIVGAYVPPSRGHRIQVRVDPWAKRQRVSH
ncbi:AAEL011002-PA [Aedes aegypti]|uniref:AAEL011002-PA n=1 Tax=Aedes aegypti TaxID=7159 RepID=Q16RC2_AEDAE|nr:AAEL011002-PA [Aedes aegypti]